MQSYIYSRSLGNENKSKKSILLIMTVLFLAMSSFERIDFFRWSGPFNLNPQVILSAGLLMCFAINLAFSHGKLLICRKLVNYLKVLLFFMATILCSAFFSADAALSFKRIFLLFAYMLSGFFSMNYLYVNHRKNLNNIVVNCVIVLILIYVIFSLYDIFVWFNLPFRKVMHSIFPYFHENIWSLGSTFVRVRGASEDPNRAGIFMAVCSFIILKYCKSFPLKMASIIACLVITLLTISRTSILCFVLLVALSFWNSKKISFNKLIIILGVVLLIIVMILLLIRIPFFVDAVNNMVLRFTVISNEHSANTHTELIEHGVNLAISNPKILVIGNGYGASYTILGDIFDGSYYSNFHNAYISFLVECGILSLFLFMYLLVLPLFKNKSLFPVVAIIILANIPYQIYSEAYFWWLLPFLCVQGNDVNTEAVHTI